MISDWLMFMVRIYARPRREHYDESFILTANRAGGECLQACHVAKRRQLAQEKETAMNHNTSVSGVTAASALLDELSEQDYAAVSGACSTNTFTLSDRYGNRGWFCTITIECIRWC